MSIDAEVMDKRKQIDKHSSTEIGVGNNLRAALAG